MTDPNADLLFAELATLTSWDRPKWERFLSEPPEIQQLLIADYRDQDWTSPATPAGARVLAILEIIGTIAGIVGGVAGAASAIKTLTGH